MRCLALVKTDPSLSTVALAGLQGLIREHCMSFPMRHPLSFVFVLGLTNACALVRRRLGVHHGLGGLPKS